ncbi:MAG: hypothetical protein KDD35_07815, partial [Bdellovibrionales bacterium]|nr:hypothetical protein [Bdellovibrionales bacterium]
ALGIKEHSDEEIQVALENIPGDFTALMLDPTFVFDRFIERNAHTKERVQKILKNKLYRQLSTTLSGSQEFTSLERLSSCLKSGKYDLIILDTPPAQHAVDFLYAPQKIYSLFQNSISKWFIKKPGATGFLQSLFNRGTMTALAALEKITGAQFIGELSDFFEGITSIQAEVSKSSFDMHRLLSGPDCGFFLITGFDRSHLDATQSFISELHRGSYNLDAILINRCLPQWSPPSSILNIPQFTPLLSFQNDFSYFIERREAELAQFCQGIADFNFLAPLIRLPDLESEISGMEGLMRLAERMESSLEGMFL